MTKGDLGWLKNKTGTTDSIYEGNRLLNLEEIDLSGGDNFLDLSGSNNSLKDESITINVGSGSDILWLSDANETVNTGLGDDEVIINGGNDTIITGNDSEDAQEMRDLLYYKGIEIAKKNYMFAIMFDEIFYEEISYYGIGTS